MYHRRNEGKRGSHGKFLAGIVIGLFVGIPLGFFMPLILQNIHITTMQADTPTQSTPNPYAGYTQIRVTVSQVTTQTFGGIKYSFAYSPAYISSLGVRQDGYVFAVSELDIVGKIIQLNTGTNQDYYRIRVIVTEVHDEYVILMVKSISP